MSTELSREEKISHIAQNIEHMSECLYRTLFGLCEPYSLETKRVHAIKKLSRCDVGLDETYQYLKSIGVLSEDIKYAFSPEKFIYPHALTQCFDPDTKTYFSISQDDLKDLIAKAANEVYINIKNGLVMKPTDQSST